MILQDDKLLKTEVCSVLDLSLIVLQDAAQSPNLRSRIKATTGQQSGKTATSGHLLFKLDDCYFWE